MPKLFSRAELVSLLADLSVGAAVNVAAASNAEPIVIQTAVAHGLLTGDWAVLVDVAGNTAANGLFKVTKVDADEVSLDGSVGNGAYTAGGTVRKVDVSGLLRKLKPWQIDSLVDAMNRRRYYRATDGQEGLGESALESIFGV